MRLVIAEPRDLPEDHIYSKERRLIEEIKKELAEGRRCQVFAVYTQKHDVTTRLQRLLSNEGLGTAVLRANVDTSKREAWYARQVKEGVQVVICHPKLVETGLDLLGLSDHHFLRIWILATHLAASQPPVLEDRAAQAGAREISLR